MAPGTSTAEFESSRARQLGIVSLSLFLWMLAYGMSLDVRFYSGALLDYFSGGYSGFKPFFALAWLFACTLVLLKPLRSSGNTHIPLVALLLAVAGQLNSLVIHIWYCVKYKIGIFEYAITSDAREISSNQLVHIHASKGVLYLLLRALGQDQAQSAVDPGRAYSELLSPWIFLLQGALVLAAGVLLLLALRKLYLVWPHRMRIPYAVLYAISSAAVVRCILDGGPFDWTNLALFPVLLVLILCPGFSPLSLLGRLFGWECLAFLLLWAVHIQAGNLQWSGVLWNAALALLFAVTAAVAALLFTSYWPRRRIALLFLTCASALCFLSTDTYWAWELRRSQLMVSPGDTIFLEDYYDTYRNLPEHAREGSLVLREYPVSEPQFLRDIYRKLGLKFGQELLTVPGQSCQLTENYIVEGRLIVLSGSVRKRSFPKPILSSLTLADCGSGAACNYLVRAEVPGCTPNTASETIVNRLTEMGFDRFVFIPD
ncbi:MAG: hypothetical protein J0M12_10265 [Deltaproteobacteria bacterium]|nr:hypothetical protein [Deltaproteobacteria bacterium]